MAALQPERSEEEVAVLNDMNRSLSAMVPVIYGALLSYAMYVMAETFIRVRYFAPPDASEPFLGAQEGLQRLLLFAGLGSFAVRDVGEVLKLDSRFPYRTPTRYVFEVAIAVFYLFAAAQLARGSYLAVPFFALAVLGGGLWCYRLRGEYRCHPSNIAAFMKTLAWLQFSAASLLLLVSGASIARHGHVQLTWGRVWCVLGVIILWLLFYEVLPFILHGNGSDDYLVNLLYRPRREQLPPPQLNDLIGAPEEA